MKINQGGKGKTRTSTEILSEKEDTPACYVHTVRVAFNIRGVEYNV